MKAKNKGFTLLEFLLTISIAGIVALTIFQSASYSMSVLRRTNSNVNLQAIRIMRQISRDLRSAFLVSAKHPTISFTGTNSSLKFISTAALNDVFDEKGEFDLKERRYYLERSGEVRSSALMYSVKNLGLRNILEEKGQLLSSSINSLTFSYFDGRQWVDSWNSSEQLPKSVRIVIQFNEYGEKSPLGYFSTVILMADI